MQRPSVPCVPTGPVGHPTETLSSGAASDRGAVALAFHGQGGADLARSLLSEAERAGARVNRPRPAPGWTSTRTHRDIGMHSDGVVTTAGPGRRAETG